MGTPTMRTVVIAASFTAALLLVAPVTAAPIPIQDLYDPTDVFFANTSTACTGTNPDHTATGDTSTATIAGCQSLSYTHSLLPEFNPALHDLLSATLTLYFHDDEQPPGTPDGPAESYSLSLDGGAAIAQVITLGSYSYNVQALMDPDGLLTVNLARAGTAAANDFFFEGSVVDATYDRTQSTPAPEPSSLFLLGAAIAAAAVHRRRRSSSISM